MLLLKNDTQGDMLTPSASTSSLSSTQCTYSTHSSHNPLFPLTAKNLAALMQRLHTALGQQ
jgi:hypothetical protein